MQQETQALYYIDSMQRTFTAQVLDCQPLDKHWAVILDRTCFYPEGGGQGADHGTLGDVHVLDCQEKNGRLLHITDNPLPMGQTVTGEIDWPRRLELMQQHTGEHMVSGLICQRYGVDNVGFHMGADCVTLDFNGPMDMQGLEEIEREVNRGIQANIPVQAEWSTPEHLKEVQYRSKKELEGDVRIVTIPSFDCCACCGVHVPSTGYVGLVKLLSCQKHKQGVRITMVCGEKAVADYQHKHRSVEAIGTMLSAHTSQVVEAVTRLKEENISLKQQLSAMQRQLFALRAQYMDKQASYRLIFEPDYTPDAMRHLCMAMFQDYIGIAAVFCGNDTEGYRYAVGSTAHDMRSFVKELNTALQGRGGGATELVQGSCQASRAQIESYFVSQFSNS